MSTQAQAFTSRLGRPSQTVVIRGLGIWTPRYRSAADIFTALATPESQITPSYVAPSTPAAPDGAELWPDALAAISDGVKGWDIDLNDCPLVFASAKGDIRRTLRPLDQPGNTIPHLADDARRMAHLCGFSDQIICLSTACASSLAALCEAQLILATQPDIPRVAVITVDLASTFVMDGFRSLRATAADLCRPFDVCRTGLAVGSGAAWAFLERSAGTTDSMEIIGWGIANDATHLTAPDPTGGGLRSAIEQALAVADIPRADVDVVLAHGTGTPFNDAMEARVFAHVFPHRPPLTAAKGLLGHSLGASGLLELALAAEILQHQLIPPICGLRTTDYQGLNPVCGRALRPDRPIRTILKTASGFGGVNAAVMVRRPLT
ncbi:MAG: beta-ketoacyl synthase N-terminal-like domain-containing protein [Phycisphaerae bacterium]